MQINVCFGFDNDYSQHCAAVIASILYNSNKDDTYVFHIISDYISDENKEKFYLLKKIKDCSIKYYKISTKEFENLNTKNKLPSSAFYRFKLFDILKINKVIYLDCDTIVRKDISELYKTNIKDYYCAGVEDIVGKTLKKRYSLSETSTYINSGVILINLKLCKEDKIYDKLIDFIDVPLNGLYGDQDILNIIVQEKVKTLDLKWNCMYKYHTEYDDKTYYNNAAKDPAIIHYISIYKPWIPGKYSYLKKDYFKYLKLTPYYNDFIFDYQIEENTYICSKLDEIYELIEKMNKS